MERNELVLLLTRSAAEGAANALRQCGSLPDAMTKSQAYRRYGRSDVDRWLAEGLISPLKRQGSASGNLLDRNTLDRIAARCNRITYLPVAER